MTVYEILAVLVAVLTISAAIGAAIVYLVRKNDKVVSLANKIPEVKESAKRIDDLEAKISAAFREIDTNRENITCTGAQICEHTKRMEESNSLILKAIAGLINAAINGNDKSSLTAVKDMLERETVVVTKRSA
ncbi:MAG: hypothetical protein FWC78_09370 [Defluviitaleaceae bacterium]|nr:hypothetical protein [Defluviitaleaceae bacterium]